MVDSQKDFENFCAQPTDVITNSGFAVYCQTHKVFYWRDGSIHSEYEYLFDYKYDAGCWKEIAAHIRPNYQWEVVEIEAFWRFK